MFSTQNKIFAIVNSFSAYCVAWSVLHPGTPYRSALVALFLALTALTAPARFFWAFILVTPWSAVAALQTASALLEALAILMLLEGFMSGSAPSLWSVAVMACLAFGAGFTGAAAVASVERQQLQVAQLLGMLQDDEDE